MIKIGTIINMRFKVVSILAHGEMSSVFEVSDSLTRKNMALKVINQDKTSNAYFIEQFKKESQATMAIHHKNVVKVIDVGEHESSPYIVYEFINAQTIRDYLDFKEPFSSLDACKIMLQLTDAIYEAHEKNIIHCDIKTSNIYLLSNLEIKLADFGLAVIEGQHIGDFKNIAGSVHYLAPEVSQGVFNTPQSDIYAMGVTFFELLTGKFPFTGDTKKEIVLAHIRRPFPSLKKYLTNPPRELDRIIAKATTKDPSRRYKSAFDMNKDIEFILKHPKLIETKKSFINRLFGLKGADD